MEKNSHKRVKKEGIAVYSPTAIASPESTGGAGYEFERQMQTLFAVLMLCDGELAFAPGKTISKVRFQVRAKGYNVDDIRLELKGGPNGASQVLVQAKRTVKFTKSCIDFTDALQAAWLDYRNSEKFNSAADMIVLATGPLRDSDRGLIDWLTNAARTREVFSLIDELRTGAAISVNRKKFFDFVCKVVRVQDASATDADVAAFLKRLFVFCPDTVYGDGLLASFAISLIKKHFGRSDADQVFKSVEAEAGRVSASGGELTKAALLNALRLADPRADEVSAIPLPPSTLALAVRTVGASGLRRDHLALLSLVGMWNDALASDREIVCQCLGVQADALNDLVQSLLQVDPPLIEAESGIVRVKRRREIWRQTASAVMKTEISCLVGIVIRQLSQMDKSLDANPDDRYMVGDADRGLGASKVLREGLAQGVALFSAEDEHCKLVPFDDRRSLSFKVVRDVLGGRDWRIWATLDGLLPYLAEVNPEEYLAIVSRFVRRREGGMSCLYGQEHGGAFGRTYIVGLVNSLSILAWFPESLAETLRILGDMAKQDPTGQWHPRPIDVFQKALHPLAPHTWASEKRRVEIASALIKRLDKRIAWDVVFSLLPGGFFSYIKDGVGPLYRGQGRTTDVEKLREEGNEGWQFDQYCSLAIPLAGKDANRLTQIENNVLRYWGDNPFYEFVGHLRKVVGRLSGKARYDMWRSLRRTIDFVRLEDEKKGKVNWEHPRLKAYISLEKEYEPKDVRYRALLLFSWDDLRQRRKTTDAEYALAIRELYRQYGVDGIIEFAAKSDRPGLVGESFGRGGDVGIDQLLLPGRLGSDDTAIRALVTGYVEGRFSVDGWQWVESVLGSAWTQEQKGMLLATLPFNHDTWLHVATLLNGEEECYWRQVRFPYVDNEGDLTIAVDGLLAVGRGYVALDTVGHHLTLNHKVSTVITLKVLQLFVDNKVTDAPTSMSCYNLGLAIKSIQDDVTISSSVKAGIEWRFFDSVDWIGEHGFRPVSLEQKLASDPQFFCEALSIAFLPAKQAKRMKEKLKTRPLSEQEERRVSNVWKLLYHWRTVPGVAKDRSFDPKQFKVWTRKAFALARKADRLTSAKNMLAQALIYAPKDPCGFWMPRAIAELLEKKGNETMLSHYRIAEFNSRGVHFVDKTGKEDRELADKYSSMADSADREGYFGLAREMRALAASIRADAVREQEEDKALENYFAAKRER